MMMSLSPAALLAAPQNVLVKPSPSSSTKSRRHRRNHKSLDTVVAAVPAAPAAPAVAVAPSRKALKTRVKVAGGTRFQHNPYSMLCATPMHPEARAVASTNVNKSGLPPTAPVIVSIEQPSVVVEHASCMLDSSSSSSSGILGAASCTSPVPAIAVRTASITSNGMIPQAPVMPSAAQRGAAFTSPLVVAFTQQLRCANSDNDSDSSFALDHQQQPVQPKFFNNPADTCYSNNTSFMSAVPAAAAVYSSSSAALTGRKDSAAFSNFDMSVCSNSEPGDSPAPAVLELPKPHSNRHEQHVQQQQQQHVYPPNTTFVVVAFKHELCTFQCGLYVVENDWVVVQADRGEHVGRVRSVQTFPPQFHVPSRILRHANFAEIQTIEGNRPNEAYAAQRIQQLATELRVEGMRVYDVEYYADGTKMTIFFSTTNSDGKVDFRELQRVVFREFRRRIWLISTTEVAHRNKNCRNRK